MINYEEWEGSVYVCLGPEHLVACVTMERGANEFM